MKTYGTVLIILVMALMVAPCTADIPPPDWTHSPGEYIAIDHCYQIENNDRYPEYIFGFSELPHPGGGFEALEGRPCYQTVYHLAMSSFCAMNRTIYTEKIAQSQEYIRDPSLVKSSFRAPSVVSVPKPSSIVSQTDVLSIVSLNSTSLVVRKVRSYNTYKDGHIEDIPEPGITETTTAPTSVPTTTPKGGLDYPFLAISAITGAAIVIVLRKRRE